MTIENYDDLHIQSSDVITCTNMYKYVLHVQTSDVKRKDIFEKLLHILLQPLEI